MRTARLMKTKTLYKHSHYELQHIPAMVYEVHILYDTEEKIIRIKMECGDRKLNISFLFDILGLFKLKQTKMYLFLNVTEQISIPQT